MTDVLLFFHSRSWKEQLNEPRKDLFVVPLGIPHYFTFRKTNVIEENCFMIWNKLHVQRREKPQSVTSASFINNQYQYFSLLTECEEALLCVILCDIFQFINDTGGWRNGILFGGQAIPSIHLNTACKPNHREAYFGCKHNMMSVWRINNGFRWRPFVVKMIWF